MLQEGGDQARAGSVAEAAGWLSERLEGVDGVVVIGVTGPVGAGKSTLTRAVGDRWPGAVTLGTDDYLPDYAKVARERRDLPEESDLERLAADIRALAGGGERSVPVWSFHEHRRTGERVVRPGRVIVVEGLHALHETVRGSLTAAVFVDAPASVRLARWRAIADAGDRGWSADETEAFFHEVAEPTFWRFGEAYRASADLVVENV